MKPAPAPTRRPPHASPLGLLAILAGLLAFAPGRSAAQPAAAQPDASAPAPPAPPAPTAPVPVAAPVSPAPPPIRAPDPIPGSRAGEGKLVFVIPVDDMIEKGLSLIMARAMRRARETGADAIILDMNTQGGRIDSAMTIRDELLKSRVPTYTYVNDKAISAGAFIALSTDKIVMAPVSNIGAALPITIGPNGAGQVERKFISYFKSEMRKTAKAKKHPAEIAEAFCDPDVVIAGLKAKGDILTLDHDEATSVRLAAYISPSIDAMIEREGLGGARVERFRFTPTDRIARFLSHPVVTGILLLIGIAGVFMEVKTPGFGAPGMIGLAAFFVFFFGSYLANLAGVVEIIVFLIGVILLAVEIFVIPGFGAAGITGIILIVGSLFFAMFNMAPDGFDSFTPERLYPPLLALAIGLVGVIPILWLMAKVLPRTEFYGRLKLAAPARKPGHGGGLPGAGAGAGAGTGWGAGHHAGAGGGIAAGPAAAAAAAAAEPLEIGASGSAITDLRPSGSARFGSRRVDVVTEGDYIPSGARVRIAEIHGARVVVHRDDGA